MKLVKSSAITDFENNSNWSQVLSVNGSTVLYCTFDVSVQYDKILPNLVNSRWLWWITHVILANQKRRNILNKTNYLAALSTWSNFSPVKTLFFFLRRFVLFCFAFLKTYFHFFADLNCKLTFSFHFHKLAIGTLWFVFVVVVLLCYCCFALFIDFHTLWEGAHLMKYKYYRYIWEESDKILFFC